MTGAEAIDFAKGLREFEGTVSTKRSEIMVATSSVSTRRHDHSIIRDEMAAACDALRRAADRMETVAGYLLVKAAMEDHS